MDEHREAPQDAEQAGAKDGEHCRQNRMPCAPQDAGGNLIAGADRLKGQNEQDADACGRPQ